MYAVIEIGGKQYKVAPGSSLEVDRLPGEEGATIEFDRVLLIAGDGGMAVGQPHLEGAKVIATIQAQGKREKVTVFKYKPKVRYRRKTGHRQLYTKLLIKEIVAPGEGVIASGP